jgi:hypothetical protein
MSKNLVNLWLEQGEEGFEGFLADKDAKEVSLASTGREVRKSRTEDQSVADIYAAHGVDRGVLITLFGENVFHAEFAELDAAQRMALKKEKLAAAVSE